MNRLVIAATPIFYPTYVRTTRRLFCVANRHGMRRWYKLDAVKHHDGIPGFTNQCIMLHLQRCFATAAEESNAAKEATTDTTPKGIAPPHGATTPGLDSTSCDTVAPPPSNSNSPGLEHGRTPPTGTPPHDGRCWVQMVETDGGTGNVYLTGSKFSVIPSTNIVDNLDTFPVTPPGRTVAHHKKAIAPDMNPRQQAAITIYARDDSGNVAVLLPGAAESVKYTQVDDPAKPLSDKTCDQPYLFALPSRIPLPPLVDVLMTHDQRPKESFVVEGIRVRTPLQTGRQTV
jgi:hypothetical protein